MPIPLLQAPVSQFVAGRMKGSLRDCLSGPSLNRNSKGGRWAALSVARVTRLAEFRRDVLVGPGAERLIRDIRVGLELVPELRLNRRDVETDPAIVLTRISAGRRFEIAAGRGRAVEHDVVLLARVPPQIVEGGNLQVLVLPEPCVLGGIERLVIFDAQAAERLVVEVDEIVAFTGPGPEQRSR